MKSLEQRLENILEQNPDSYGDIEGIPFLYPDHKREKTLLSRRVANFFVAEKIKLKELKESKDPIRSKRIEKVIAARTKHLSRLKTAMGELLVTEEPTGGLDPLNSYEELFFRDWCWQGEELKHYLEFLNGLGLNGEVLALGAGACGLTSKVATENPNASILATDINPFLFMPVKKIFNGKSFKAVDTPSYPLSGAHAVNKFDISPKAEPQNHTMAFADFISMPFRADSFDHVNATWFLDVIPYGLRDSLAHIGYFLKPEGSFSFIGPANIHKDSLSERFQAEEIVETVKEYFSLVSWETKEIAYMESGYESQKRIETVLFISAKEPVKSKVAKLVPSELTKVPFNQKLQIEKAKAETFHRILKHVDSEMNFETLAQRISTEFGFQEEEALHYAKAFIKKILS